MISCMHKTEEEDDFLSVTLLALVTADEDDCTDGSIDVELFFVHDDGTVVLVDEEVEEDVCLLVEVFDIEVSAGLYI